MDAGFGFVSLQTIDDKTMGIVVQSFKPELMIFIPDVAGAELPSVFNKNDEGEFPRRYVLRAGGGQISGAPTWPEFSPIWLNHGGSQAELVEFRANGTGEVIASTNVPVGDRETAVTLRLKHSEALAALLLALLDGSDLTKAERAEAQKCTEAAVVPQGISFEWDDSTVDRFVRAHFFPPRDPAQVVNPTTGEAYYVENLEQYQEFRARVLQDGVRTKDEVQGAYAADTHWYSNVGGSIVKMGDSDIHMPTKAADRKRPVVIPGAALGARKKLRMNEPLIGPNAERYCSSALESGWIGVEGPRVKQFEKQLAQICGCNAACAVHSGTAALYGAMKALGVSDPSHHVLVPTFTCSACADAVVHAGGRPIPIDCEMDSYGLSIEAVRKVLESDKDVVGVVNAPCYGVPSRDFFEVHALCKEKGIWLCEDACESYGAVQCVRDQDGQLTRVPIGSLATLCVISVRSEKMIGVGEGGAILGNDTPLVARAKWWCSRAPCRGVGLWRVYEHDAVGQNFRLPEMLAAVGCAAAEMLPVMVERKRAIHSWYEAGIASHPALQGVKLQKCVPGDEPVWWINAALMPQGVSGEKVGMRLMADFPDIEIRPGFFPLNMMGIFKSPWMKPCPNAECLYDRLVCLPSSNQLTKLDVDRVCGALAASLSATIGAEANSF